MESGATDAVICTHWAEGGAGATALADAVIAATEKKNNFKLLYDLEDSIEEKINKIAKEIYGAGQVVLAEKVNKFYAIRINYATNYYQIIRDIWILHIPVQKSNFINVIYVCIDNYAIFFLQDNIYYTKYSSYIK